MTEHQTGNDPLLEAGLERAFSPDTLPVVPRVTESEPVHIEQKQGPDTLPSNPGRFQILGEVARGGMGTVLEVFDRDLGRTVAVKVLHERLRHDENARRRFLTEAQITGQLHHPGIPPIHDLGRGPDGTPSIVMELIRGRTLADILKERSSPTQDQPRLLRLFSDLCRIVAYAHGSGVVHRDIKPLNVMVGPYGEVFLLDWGVARILRNGETQPSTDDTPTPAQATRAGTVIGTPGYMAPEQARGDVSAITPATDVFALGCMLCEVLTGQPPVTGSTKDVRKKLAAGDMDEGLTRLRATDADPELLAITERALAPSPDHRYPDARSLRDALVSREEQLTQRAQAAERARIAAESRATAERRAKRLTITGSAAIVLLLILGAAGWRILEDQRQHEIDLRLTAIQNQSRELTAQTAAAQAINPPDPQAWEPAKVAALQLTSLTEDESNLTEGLLATIRSQLRTVAEGAAGAEADFKRRQENARMLAAFDELRYSVTDPVAANEQLVKVRQTLRDLGMDPLAVDEPVALEWLQQRGIPAELAAGLDVWSTLHSFTPGHDQENTGRLDRLARALDPDEWRNKLRQAKLEGEALDALLEEPEFGKQPPTTVGLVVEHLLHNDLELMIEDVPGEYGIRERPKGDSTQVEALLRKVLLVHPQDPWLNFQMAHLLVAHANPPRPKDAEVYARSFWTIRPEDPTALYVHATTLGFQGQQEEALMLYRQVTDSRISEASGQNVGAWLAAGTILLDQDRNEEALPLLEYYVERRPQDPSGRLNYANVLWELGQRDEALGSYKVAADNSGSPQITLLYADQLASTDPLGALEVRIQVEEEHPEIVDAHWKLAESLISEGRYRAGRDQALEAVEMDAGNHEAHYQLGRAYRFLGQLPEAEDAFDKALDLDNSCEGTLYMLGVVHRQLGELTPALEYFERARDRAREVMDVALLLKSLNQLGYAKALGGRYEQAVEDYQTALDWQNTGPNPWMNLAWTQWLMQEPEAAIQTLTNAMEFVPEDSQAALYRSRSEYLLAVEKVDEAIADAETAVSKDDSATTLLAAGHGYEEAGRLDDALESFRWAENHGTDKEFEHARDDRQRLTRMIALMPQLSSLVAGDELPQGVDELLAAARLCEVRNEPIAAARLFEAAWVSDPKHLLDDDSQNVEDAVQSVLRAAALQEDPEEASRQRATALSWWDQRYERLLEVALQPTEGQVHAEQAEEVLLAQRSRRELMQIIDALSGEEAKRWNEARARSDELLRMIWSARWEAGR